MILMIEWFWKRQNYRDTERSLTGRGLHGGRPGWVGGAQGIFRVEKLFADTNMVAAYHYNVKP